MKYQTKAKICIVMGIGLIVFVASLVNLPFMHSDSAVQKITQKNISKLEDSEQRLTGFMQHEKSELAQKIGKNSFP